MQLQKVGYSVYSSNNSQKADPGNPSFGVIRVCCAEETERLLGSDAKTFVKVSNAWFKDIPPEYAGLLNRFAEVVKLLEINVFRTAERTFVGIVDDEIPTRQILGYSKESDIFSATEEASFKALDAWAKTTCELQTKPAKALR